MIRLESVVVAVLGGVLGHGAGRALRRRRWSPRWRRRASTELAIPWPLLGGFLLLAAVAGVLAAVFPARRAARLDVLRAIGTE